MATFNVHDAKTRLSELLARVEAGEEIILARSGHPVARLIPIAPAEAPRHPGSAKGVVVSEDFDAPLPDEVLRGFR